jgi:hypothetical protein
MPVQQKAPATCGLVEKRVRTVKTPERTTAEVFSRYLGGEVLADSATLKWPGLFVRRYRFPRVVDGFLVPATAEPRARPVVRLDATSVTH